MRFQILCDSCCDLTATERLSSVFGKVPATVTVSGVRLTDDKQFQQAALLHALSAESLELKVAFPDEKAYLDAVDPAAEAVFFVTASASAFDQYETASRARRILLERQPARHVHVFNTRSGSVGQLVTARRVCELARSGCDYRQIVEQVEAELLRASLFLLPASDDGLRQSGLLPRRGGPRVPAAYTATEAGRLVRAAAALTARGLEKRLLPRILARETAGKTCLIAHCGCIDAARRWAALLGKQASFSNLILLETGALNTLALGLGGVAIGF